MASKKSSLARLGAPGKLAVGALMLGLPAVGYFVVFHGEIQSEINAARSTGERLRAELQQAEAAEHAYQRDLEELRRRERAKRELVKILPESTEYPAFLSSVQNVANLVGVELVAWTPQEEVPEEFYARVPMKLELVGRYHQLAKFFYNVGQIERIINMENIAIKDPEVVDGEVRLKVAALATAFHAVEEQVDDQGTQGRRRRDRRK